MFHFLAFSQKVAVVFLLVSDIPCFNKYIPTGKTAQNFQSASLYCSTTICFLKTLTVNMWRGLENRNLVRFRATQTSYGHIRIEGCRHPPLFHFPNRSSFSAFNIGLVLPLLTLDSSPPNLAGLRMYGYMHLPR